MGEMIWAFVVGGATLAGVLLGNILSNEVSDYLDWAQRRLIAAAVRALPETHRARYAEEWTADIEERPGRLTKLYFALDIFFRAGRMTRELVPVPNTELEVSVAKQARRSASRSGWDIGGVRLSAKLRLSVKLLSLSSWRLMRVLAAEARYRVAMLTVWIQYFARVLAANSHYGAANFVLRSEFAARYLLDTLRPAKRGHNDE